MCAHPKVDPATGEMVLFRYNIEAPFLTWSVVAPDGSVSSPPSAVEVDGASYMIHDFAITASSVVIFVGPLQFDFDAMFAGGDMLAWKPDLGMRVAVVARQGGAVRWIHTDAFWVWHFANAFDRRAGDGRDEIVVDYTEWSRPGFAGAGPVSGAISRAVIDPDAGTLRVEHFGDETAEFARIDDRLIGHPHRFFVVTTRTAGMALDEQNILVRVDTEKGSLEKWVSGDSVFDEVCFVPEPGGAANDGYYATFRTDRTTLTSDFVLLAASDISAGPIVRVPLPFRVPSGLHGNWFPQV